VAVALGSSGTQWQRLWALAGRVAAGIDGETAGVAFSDVGLFLEDPGAPPRHGGYDLSPADSVLIAGAGSGGVHFSALRPDRDGAAPIVMTVPTVFDAPNVVVGADLREFLALGCTSGYAGLEQLAHDHPGDWGRTAMIRRAQSAEPGQHAGLLAALTGEFGLQPWPDVADRLAELDRRYSGRVRPSWA
jgi:hypothetical protein